MVFTVSRGTCTATHSTPSLRSALPHHAAFPSRFRVQVGWVSPRSPPPEPRPPAGAIQRRVRRRTVSRQPTPPAHGPIHSTGRAGLTGSTLSWLFLIGPLRNPP